MEPKAECWVGWFYEAEPASAGGRHLSASPLPKMTRALEDLHGLSAPDAKVLTDIRSSGFHITGVFPRENEDGPDWAFSIGLFHSYHHPEVIVSGLPLNTCMSVVSVIGEGIKSGKGYEPGPAYAHILEEPYSCVFKGVLPSHYADYVGYAMWFYEADLFPLLQCFWSDKEYRFPWDEDCDEDVKNSQPLLFTP